jgi:hypothetical protein
MSREPRTSDPDAGVVDDKIAQARERIAEIVDLADGPAAERGSGPRANQAETIMTDAHKTGLAERAKAALHDIAGLPPGDSTPHGHGRPARDPDAPHGSLTADDAEGVPLPGTATDNSREAS